jgi:hypothetical protein
VPSGAKDIRIRQQRLVYIEASAKHDFKMYHGKSRPLAKTIKVKLLKDIFISLLGNAIECAVLLSC